VAFSPNGATLAAGDGDNDVRLWDVSHLTNVVSSLCASLTHAEWSLQGAGHLTLCS
jgi:WD40 repeat protein